MSVPVTPFHLMHAIYKQVFPLVHSQLQHWKIKAEQIPNEELRRQALASIEHKTFHCEGGAVLALLAGAKIEEAIRFIVAYQTISDYLDNLCDRSTSLDPADFAALHEAMEDSIVPDAPIRSYYRFREDQEDGGYLNQLVRTCQSVLQSIAPYSQAAPYLQELCRYYCDLQIHKHVKPDERETRLIGWFADHQKNLPEMEWYEFSACAGSTLGIFCMISYSLRDDFQPHYAKLIRDSYFPYIQGLHILLDYLIDQAEDREGGDLNFCFYYPGDQQLLERIHHFIQQADHYTANLPHSRFHKLVNRGLLGVYLSDEKAFRQKDIRKISKQVIRKGGTTSYFFYWNGRTYRRMQQVFPKLFIKKSAAQ
ncbi:tetraprenyl-beta-curcumene synthase [Bacillus ectoiniformans]|uniref:tetraprenyl-beta-curcumene synthase family protein n=1 Tax=Bacillus ectoiniformans TaxID=1494429 RepID=UPI00195D7A69|nr:tetraprenyl-beta-curcumene synthase family protein [Bacillus ectoiniformans]MBM7649711.1 tetraprenyl-beta-curcumene synthase [Bacillus ectoiniformans]